MAVEQEGFAAAASTRRSALTKLVSFLDRAGDIAQQPPFWAATAALLAVGVGERGRRAAWRGSVYYAVAAVVVNLIKPLVDRSRPSAADEGERGPITSSFPSGHTATDLAFVFGAAQELRALFGPLAAASAAAHWSLVRSRAHYVGDVLAGGLLAIAVAWVMPRVWPRHNLGVIGG